MQGISLWSQGPARFVAAILGAAVAIGLGAAGCAKNVAQHANSGKDYRYRGAKPIKLEDGEGRARDIVTYPGGDRVDWKVLELPEGARGTLRIKLRWRPPRPRLDLAFNVYNAWFERVAEAKPSKSGRKRSKTIRIENASGKYYVQIYASRRKDAGRYTVSVRFRESEMIDLDGTESVADLIRDPPRLPAVPEIKEKTPEELAAEEEERQRLEEEERLRQEDLLKEEERLGELRKPVFARISRTQRSANGVIITINAGKNRNVEKGWVGNILRGSSERPLAGGDFKIIRVTRRESIAKVQLSMDQVVANPRVELRRNLE